MVHISAQIAYVVESNFINLCIRGHFPNCKREVSFLCHGEMQGIKELIDCMLSEFRAISGEERSRFHPKESIGTCPVCGNPVYERKKKYR